MPVLSSSMICTHFFLVVVVRDCVFLAFNLTSSSYSPFITRSLVTTTSVVLHILYILLCIDGISTSSCVRASIECVRQSVI